MIKAVTIFSLQAVAVTLTFSFCTGTSAKKQSDRSTDKGFAVVELFTSEGCSSCPPADEAMIKLAKEFPEGVYFLGYHVDYWDQIGWKDQFDNPDYTKRQNSYAELLGLESIYTPQVIVNGEKELVGSRESQLRSIIQERLKGTVAADIQLRAKIGSDGSVEASYTTVTSRGILLHIALVQLKASTNVMRGENKGRQLNHINIVRELQTIAIDKKSEGKVNLKIPPGLTASDLKLIAILQNEKDMKIVGAVGAAIQ